MLYHVGCQLSSSIHRAIKIGARMTRIMKNVSAFMGFLRRRPHVGVLHHKVIKPCVSWLAANRAAPYKGLGRVDGAVAAAPEVMHYALVEAHSISCSAASMAAGKVS